MRNLLLVLMALGFVIGLTGCGKSPMGPEVKQPEVVQTKAEGGIVRYDVTILRINAGKDLRISLIYGPKGQKNGILLAKNIKTSGEGLLFSRDLKTGEYVKIQIDYIFEKGVETRFFILGKAEVNKYNKFWF